MKYTKLASVYFTTSESVLSKDTNKRVKYTKLALVYFTTSESIFEIYLKDTNKRVRKLSKRMGENLFSHAMSAANFAKSKYQVYFNIFQNERKYLIVSFNK